MSAAELLEQAEAEGVLLVLDDGRLTWEADHEPPGELLEEIRTHRLEIIEALSEANDPSQPDMEWLARLAVLLCCTPDYLLEHGYVDRHDLAEQRHIHPRFAARLIRTHPDWRPPSERSAHVREGVAPTETAEFRDQYAPAREGGLAAAHCSPTWRAARDALHRHAYGNCPHCCPPKGRYCAVGAELCARYDYETSALETHHE